ncbi:DNA glycosylase AlkZ-like family protein [Geodermatophilus sp. URMC 64]
MPRPIVSRARVLAWRLSAHGLAARLPAERRAEAVRPAGLRTGGPDSAVVGWHARADGVGADDVRDALGARRWVEAPTARGARVLDPRDLGTLTAGALPVDDDALVDRLRRRGVAAGQHPAALLRDGADAARAALDAAPRTQGELSQVVTAALPPSVSAFCKPCRAVHVDTGLFAMVGLAVGWVRAADREDGAFVRPEQWLDDPPVRDPAAGAAALLGWFLRAHSPTTPGELATWLGLGAAEARQRWTAAPELTEVDHDGRRAWVPTADLPGLTAAEPAEGVRLLPPYDAALEGPDRSTLVPDRAQQKEVWRMVANPGVALVDGAVSCAWRARKQGRRLDVRLVRLDGWRPAHERRITEELAVVAALRGAELGDVRTDATGPVSRPGPRS